MHRPRTGVVIGRFMPPHRGHQYLFDFAADYSDELVIFVCTLPEEPIPGKLRFKWIKDMNRDARVVHITERIPEAQRDHPNSFSIWAATMQSHMDGPIDFVFASESYGWKLAGALAAQFVSVDSARHVFPVSGTDIRTAPYDNWEFIPEVVRPYYLRRVAVIESREDGEGRFAHDLATRLRTVVVQDYLTYWESLGLSLASEEDLRHVLRAQRASQRALEPHANGVLILAGEPLGIAAEWIDRNAGLPGWFDEEAEYRADHYLLVGLSAPLRENVIRLVKALGVSFHEFGQADPSGLEMAVGIAKALLTAPSR